MWRANHFWQTIFLAAVSAFLLEIADCAFAGCGAGTFILAFRVTLPSMVLAAMAQLAGPVAFTSRPVRLQLLIAAVIVAPLAVSSGYHLSESASVSRLLSYRWRLIIPSVALFTLYAGYFVLIIRNGRTAHATTPGRILFAIIWLTSTILLFIGATYFKKLHYPLSVACLFFSWINLQNATAMALGTRAPRLARTGVGAFVAVGLLMIIWPVSLEDTFIASDQGILARDLTSLGRAHTMDELVEQAVVPRLIPPKEPVPVEALPHYPGKSVILISVDALRPDHLGFHGYKRDVSPHIDQLLRQSVDFETAYCTAPSSSFSIPSIHAGIPMEHLLKSAAPIPPLLATRFKEMGYTTVGLYPPKVFSMGPSLMGTLEETHFGFEYFELLKMDAQSDVRIALRQLGKHAPNGPLFMWVHFYDPHLPYTCHGAPYGNQQQDCYDAEIAYLDSHIKPFLDEIANLADEPIVAFTADHGEAFGEHGRYYHSTDLYDEQIRVPLAFKIPGVAPGRITTPVSNCSIFDTLISLVQPAPDTAKNDLRPLMVGSGEVMPAVSIIGAKRAVVFGNHKLICEKWPDGACALFNLNQDPAEKKNLAAKQITKTVEMLGLLKEAHETELALLKQTAPRAIILGRLKHPEAVVGLIRLARDNASPWAVEAAKLLALLGSRHVDNALNDLSQSHIPEVMAWATIGKALLGNSFDAGKLYPYVMKNSDLGHWSIIVLGRNGDPIALKPLLRLLKHEEPNLRALAALALGQMGNSKAVPALISLLDTKQSRWAAIEALGNLADRRALAKLRALKRSEPDISNLPRYEKAIDRIENN
ncbi:MAG: sulfatase-like hydrolase/transferase [Deltaproteobacteria bacterium]|nr:sulfatase-like hydrolase/transferase [Deltaproteobacteria bacterium]